MGSRSSCAPWRENCGRTASRSWCWSSDEIRRVLTPSPCYSETEREVVYAAKLLTDTGMPVIIDATASRRVWRQLARTLIRRFAEVQLVCPSELCLERERLVRWGLEPSAPGRVPGATEPPEWATDYEHSCDPDLTIRSDQRDPSSAAMDIARLAARLERTGERATRSEESTTSLR